MGRQLKKAILKPTTTGRGVFDHIGPVSTDMEQADLAWA
jgi:hypothetical protein